MVISDVFSVWVTAVPADVPFRSKINGSPDVLGWKGVEYALRNCGETAPPGSPCGITKLRIACWLVPLLVTSADVPGAPVVTVPISMVAASPAGPAGPVAPGQHGGTQGHTGKHFGEQRMIFIFGDKTYFTLFPSLLQQDKTFSVHFADLLYCMLVLRQRFDRTSTGNLRNAQILLNIE